MSFAERRTRLIEEWTAHVWVDTDFNEDEDRYNEAEIEGVCNCFDCRMDRSNEIIHRLMKSVYDIGFIPRNHDPLMGFNGHEPDAYYEEDEGQVRVLLNDMERLRKNNKNQIQRLKEEGTWNKRKIGYCYDCGTIHWLKGSMRIGKVGGKVRTLCQHCSLNYITCVHCGEIKRKYNSHVVDLDDLGNEVRICKVCYAENYTQCTSCRQVKLKENFKQFPTGRNDRGEITYFSLCNECSTTFGTCDLCGDEVPEGIIRIYGQQMVCPACAEAFTPVHRHAYSPLRLNFHRAIGEGKNQTNSLYFGFELEIEANGSWISVRESMADLIKEKAGLDRVYVVQDGSLSHGVEMVSYPFTWERFKKDRDHWTEVLQYCKSKGWESFFTEPGKTVGMHIHTSKAAWGTFQIYKMMEFMYNPAHRNFLQLIGQRESNQYCRWSSADNNGLAQLAKEKKNLDSTHYNVVNLNDKRSYNQSGGGKTIEFRMFAGTLEPLHFFKNIEFVYALFCFTRDRSKKEMHHPDFLDYVINHRRTWPSLSEFLGITKGGK